MIERVDTGPLNHRFGPTTRGARVEPRAHDIGIVGRKGCEVDTDAGQHRLWRSDMVAWISTVAAWDRVCDTAETADQATV